jgi:hypothetical protein
MIFFFSWDPQLIDPWVRPTRKWFNKMAPIEIWNIQIPKGRIPEICSKASLQFSNLSQPSLIKDTWDGRNTQNKQADLHIIRAKQHGRSRRRLQRPPPPQPPVLGQISPTRMSTPSRHLPFFSQAPLGTGTWTTPCWHRLEKSLRGWTRHVVC